VLNKIGKVAYELNLPVGSQIHPIFHVSQLKRKVGPITPIHSQLPVMGSEGRLKISPVAILDRRMVKKRNVPVVEVLVQWANLAAEDATWENYEELIHQFPINCLEDKPISEMGAMSGERGLVNVILKFESVKEQDKELTGPKQKEAGWATQEEAEA
jgi:Chromo (CHRromatin Organisation MOdifier) domain